jgi:hypothetical protein
MRSALSHGYASGAVAGIRVGSAFIGWAARAIAWGRPWGINPTGRKRMSTSIRIKRYSILLVLPKHIAQANMLMAIFDFLIGFRSK